MPKEDAAVKKSAEEQPEECFVIMPISDPEGYSTGHFRHVFDDIFVPACEAAGYRATRADQVVQTNLIQLDVLRRIVESPMALCDLSTRNPNVLFELGLRQAFDKPVVLVREVDTPPIFDIAPFRYHEYRRELIYHEVLEDQSRIAGALLATKGAAGSRRDVNSIVRLLELTRPASLQEINDFEENPAMQLLMAEIRQLRAEIRNSRASSVDPDRSRAFRFHWDLSSNRVYFLGGKVASVSSILEHVRLVNEHYGGSTKVLAERLRRDYPLNSVDALELAAIAKAAYSSTHSNLNDLEDGPIVVGPAPPPDID